MKSQEYKFSAALSEYCTKTDYNVNTKIPRRLSKENCLVEMILAHL